MPARSLVTPTLVQFAGRGGAARRAGNCGLARGRGLRRASDALQIGRLSWRRVRSFFAPKRAEAGSWSGLRGGKRRLHGGRCTEGCWDEVEGK